MESPLFFPETGRPRNLHRQEPVDLDNKVDHLVSVAMQGPPISRSMQRFLKSYPNFSRIIERHVRILLRRSLDLSEGEVTIFDKALLVITNNGSDVQSSAAILFFCEKWLEYTKAAATPTDAMHEMARIAELPWDREMKRDDRHQPALHTSPTISEFDQGRLLTDDSVNHLLATYNQAKQDFQNVEHLRNSETESAARYLRDTAENAVDLLQGSNVSRQKLSEMMQTLEISKAVVQDLSGKYRKFDPGYRQPEPRHQDPRGARRDRPHRQDQRPGYEARRIADGYIKIDDQDLAVYAEAPRADDPAQREDAYERARTRDAKRHNYHANKESQRRRSRSPGRRNYRSRKKDDDVGKSGFRFKGNAKTDVYEQEYGRGHSGVPYGYRDGRIVDSYRPGN